MKIENKVLRMEKKKWVYMIVFNKVLSRQNKWMQNQNLCGCNDDEDASKQLCYPCELYMDKSTKNMQLSTDTTESERQFYTKSIA